MAQSIATFSQPKLSFFERTTVVALLLAMITMGSALAQDNQRTLLADAKIAQGAVDRRSLASPARNTVYSCNRQEMGAALDRPWVNANGVIDLTNKPTIEGAVSWKSRFDLARDNQSVTITGNGLPNHPTGIFPVERDSPAFRYDRNPNSIRTHALRHALPVSPEIAPEPGCLPMGVIGIALTGGVFFNALDAPGRDAVANEIFDRCEGHPERNGRYHYHHGSPCFAAGNPESHSPLVGYALDGFGIHGPRGEGGEYVSNAQLDECHGHTGPVSRDREGTKIRYHYHVNHEFPYTLGCFKGLVSADSRPGGPGSNQRQVQGIPSGALSVTTLGTGGPRDDADRAGPSALVRFGDRRFLVDMGRDTQRRLAQAKIDLREIETLMFTHHHLDHNEEFVPILLKARLRGGGGKIIGPPGTRAYVDFLLDFYKEDSDYRAARTGRSGDAMRNVDVLEVQGGESFQVDRVAIKTARVNHTIHTVAYRFDAGGKSIVISGDLTFSDSLVDLAADAEILVIDSGRVAAFRRESERAHTARRRRGGRPMAHGSVEDVASMAQRANVKRLVLTHIGSANFDETAVRSHIGKTFTGEVIFAKDLMEIRP